MHTPVHRLHPSLGEVEIKKEGWEYHLPLVRDLMARKLGFSPYAFVINSTGDIRQGSIQLRSNVSNADWGQASSFEEFIFNQVVQEYWGEFYSLNSNCNAGKPTIKSIEGGFEFQLQDLVGIILYDCCTLEGSDFEDYEYNKDYTSEEIDTLKYLALLKSGHSYKHEYNTPEEQSLTTYKEWLKRELVWHDDENHHGELVQRFKATANFSHTVAAILATIQSGYIPDWLEKLVSPKLFKELEEHSEALMGAYPNAFDTTFSYGWFHPEDQG